MGGPLSNALAILAALVLGPLAWSRAPGVKSRKFPVNDDLARLAGLVTANRGQGRPGILLHAKIVAEGQIQ